jgi:hypothetical protein
MNRMGEVFLTLEVESQAPDGFEKPDAVSICFDVCKFIQRFKPLAHDVSALAQTNE